MYISLKIRCKHFSRILSYANFYEFLVEILAVDKSWLLLWEYTVKEIWRDLFVVCFYEFLAQCGSKSRNAWLIWDSRRHDEDSKLGSRGQRANIFTTPPQFSEEIFLKFDPLWTVCREVNCRKVLFIFWGYDVKHFWQSTNLVNFCQNAVWKLVKNLLSYRTFCCRSLVYFHENSM